MRDDAVEDYGYFHNVAAMGGINIAPLSCKSSSISMERLKLSTFDQFDGQICGLGREDLSIISTPFNKTHG